MTKTKKKNALEILPGMATRVELWKIDRLLPYGTNPWNHPAEQIDRLAASITRLGFNAPILVDGETIVAGHARLTAAKRLGLEEVPVVPLDHLDEETARAYRLADNRIGELAELDTDLLEGELLALDDDLVDVAGWNLDELEELGVDLDLAGDPEPKDPADGAVYQEPAGPPVSASGDLWILSGDAGDHRVLCGNSTNPDDVARLMDGRLGDMVFTDPPYGVSFVGVKGSMFKGGSSSGRDSSEAIQNDDLRGDELEGLFRDALSTILPHIEDKAALYIFFGINRSAETLPAISAVGLKIRNWLIWDKGNVGFHAMGAQYKPNYESFLYCHKSGSSPKWTGSQTQQTIWRHSREGLGLHPTMKPVGLIAQAIDNHEPRRLVDPFLGSGSSLMAAELRRRECFGLEIDPRYCDVIVRRWQELTGLSATLDDDGRTFAELAAARGV